MREYPSADGKRLIGIYNVTCLAPATERPKKSPVHRPQTMPTTRPAQKDKGTTGAGPKMATGKKRDAVPTRKPSGAKMTPAEKEAERKLEKQAAEGGKLKGKREDRVKGAFDELDREEGLTPDR